MLNNQQKIIAAYQLCRLRNIDPETLIPHSPNPNPDGTVNAVLLHTPVWKIFLQEIEQYELLLQAINYAYEQN